MVLAVGYRVSTPRAVQFRQWATTVLREYLVKGFALDDPRLKDPAGSDYFDELLQRIRDIRASSPAAVLRAPRPRRRLLVVAFGADSTQVRNLDKHIDRLGSLEEHCSSRGDDEPGR
ncbi:MAG: RhuM family protein [Pseudonocardiaceae bacterium]